MANQIITARPEILSRYFVPGTVTLSFVSLWHFTTIVWSGLVSMAFQIDGIAEQAMAQSAPGSPEHNDLLSSHKGNYLELYD